MMCLPPHHLYCHYNSVTTVVTKRFFICYLLILTHHCNGDKETKCTYAIDITYQVGNNWIPTKVVGQQIVSSP